LAARPCIVLGLMLERLEGTRLGEMPPLGAVPERMLAQVIRPERYGEPSQAFAVEEIETPRPGPGEALVYVMAAGVNYNNPWAPRAASMVAGATAYRRLCGWPPHTVDKDDVVLIWGGSGGLGSQAIQIARAKGALPIAVVSGEAKGEYCKRLGAIGYVDRRN